ncbi:hypothetical protein CEXT_77011 [Caerostris extrusa]|uniref:Uncharacterized protein n=1 Tax=Caerostris extrusa TaxID=172846 RepID=A0AAV4QX17_CAEEX|nr:hypothetical protein CEXT_77011 [Caerostris extrusa]
MALSSQLFTQVHLLWSVLGIEEVPFPSFMFLMDTEKLGNRRRPVRKVVSPQWLGRDGRYGSLTDGLLSFIVQVHFRHLETDAFPPRNTRWACLNPFFRDVLPPFS